ncbi:2-hydroxyacid dehydrogenase [Thauera sinica]|uniref:2-hydroxyacid dehydrogenase n=1 Tax=Thauera sinica TaxID=2665146 RepID=A0ABW1AST1_9RHOO|nr:D-glycerate dehydrogenase [Thauera sp. K11]ATE61441.1 D-glycerate dehydrogenase [Thauera sp. K11]
MNTAAARPKVIVTGRLPEEVERELQARFDAQLNTDDRPFTARELQEALQTADGLLTTVADRLTAEVLDVPSRRATIIANYGVGYNHIDVHAAKALGIAVTNTPDVLTDCTADLAIMLMLMTARRAGEGERLVRAGRWRSWRPTHMIGTRVSGKTLGIIGMGRIGQATARRAQHGFGMKVVFFNRSRLAPERLDGLDALQCDTVEEVLAQADFVSLHCPGGEETRHLMNATRFAAMQRHAFLINTARGDVVDEAALADALGHGLIAGAGLDVYEHEPRVPAALLEMENVVLLPHLGSATRETRTGMGLMAVDNLSAHFAGQTPPNRVV